MNIYDCVIIGSGPAGITATIYMCRNNYKTALITGSEIGGTLAKISTIENFPSFNQIKGYELASQMYNQLENFNNLTKYEFYNAINFEKNDKNILVKLDNDNEILQSKTLIIAIGGKHKVLNLKNEENFFGKGISFCATCDGPMYKDKNVAIIGGGNTAMDFALTLSNYCNKISIFHRRDEFRADKTMLEKVKALKNVTLFRNCTIDSIMEENNKFIGLNIKSKDEEKLYHMFFDGCFYAIGFEKNELPEINIKKDQINYNNIFYCGDCIDEKYRQVITACGDGCKSAINCINYLKNEEEEN